MAYFLIVSTICSATNDSLAELDAILDGINGVLNTISTSSSQNNDPKVKSNAPPTNTATSTGIKGVGYDRGLSIPFATSDNAINKNIAAAAKKQSKEDELLQPFLSRLVTFIQGYDGSEGVVLLSLKMSSSFNRMLFNLLKNDSLLEWGKRNKIYETTLNLIDKFSASQFYVGMLVHNLLEGNSLPYDGSATCEALIGTLHVKANIMVRSQKKMATTDAPRKKVTSHDDNDYDALTLAMCEKIIASAEKMNAAIKSGREQGIVVNPENETTSKDVASSGPTHLKNLLLAEAAGAAPPSLEEQMAAYVKEMTVHRLKHVDNLVTGKTNLSDYKFRNEAISNTASSSSVKRTRMLHIASEIAGLSNDLPVEWHSGIFVVVDEERPDALKALIMPPEGTPYENGCFEFDIYLPLAYPDCPPKVNIVTTSSNTVRFNPNLYSNGKGTCTGDDLICLLIS